MHWSENRTPRSVNALKLWTENPRLVEDEDIYAVQKIIIKEIFDKAERKFTNLMKSIAQNGFLYFDTVIVFQDEKDNFIVLEGNRRIAALKLFHNYKLAPKAKWSTVKRIISSVTFDLEDIQKVKVAVAPSFNDAIYFITQRHTTEQVDQWNYDAKQRWILKILENCSYDIEEASKLTGYTLGEIKEAYNTTLFYDYAKILPDLTEPERAFVHDQHKFPHTTLTRFVNSSIGKEFLHLTYNDGEFIINSLKETFDKLFLFVIQEIANGKMTSRTIDTNSHIKDYLDEKFGTEWPSGTEDEIPLISLLKPKPEPEIEPPIPPAKPPKPRPYSGSFVRAKIPSNMHLKTENERLKNVFFELKKISANSMPNCMGVMLRIFLDLVVKDYINSFDELKKDLKKEYPHKNEQRKLSNQIRFLLKHKDLKDFFSSEIKGVMEKYMNPKEFIGLDTLDKYVHGSILHPTREHLQNQWNAIYQFTKCLLEFEEK